MENKQDNTFSIINDNGEEFRCEVLFTYTNEKRGVDYIANTGNATDDTAIRKFTLLFLIQSKRILIQSKRIRNFCRLKPKKSGSS